MRRTALAAFALVICLPLTTQAQQWNADQQAVIDHSNECWQAWDDAVRQRDYDVWMETCQPADDFRGWWVPNTTLWTNADLRRFFGQLIEWQLETRWLVSTPLDVRIYDDFALYWYLVQFSGTDNAGKITMTEQMRFETFQEVDGVWRWNGAMVVDKESSVLFEGN